MQDLSKIKFLSKVEAPVPIMNIKGQEGKLNKFCIIYLHADRMRFVNLATSTVYKKQNTHNMMDEIVLNKIIIKK